MTEGLGFGPAHLVVIPRESNNDPDWKHFTADLSAFAGKTISVVASVCPIDNHTYMLLDDVEFLVPGATPAAGDQTRSKHRSRNNFPISGGVSVGRVSRPVLAPDGPGDPSYDSASSNDARSFHNTPIHAVLLPF